VIFSLTILGSSSALPTSLRFPTAHVLNVHERLFLIDCGEGAQIQLRRYHLKMNRINHAFISHVHGDHTLGLIGLLSTFNLLGRKNPFTVFAPSEFEEALFFNLKFYANNLTFPVNFVPVDTFKSQVIYEDKHVMVTTLPLHHRVPAVGYLFTEVVDKLNIKKTFIDKYKPGVGNILRIKAGNDYVSSDGTVICNSDITYHSHLPRKYAYCSDTLYSERLVGLVKNVDLLYHEATFSHNDLELARATGHSTAVQAATVASKANVDMLLIGHFSSRYKKIGDLEHEAKQVFEKTIAVSDGQTFTVPEKRNILV